MRIIEPQKYQHGKNRQRHKRHGLLVLAPVLLIIGGIVAGYLHWGRTDGPVAQSLDTTTPAQQVEPAELEPTVEDEPEQPETESQPKPEQEPEPVSEPALRQFGDNDFKLFYDQLKQSGVSQIENPPEISGNVAADERIQAIAEDRGYRLRGTPSIELTSVDGYPVQPAIVQDWLDLKAAAAAEGHSLSIVSAYRSVSHQRTLFLSRLAATGATIEQVAAGDVDDKVDSVLVTSSIPGYSKHHTGYTIDILCAGWAFENFKNSPCNTWVSANNYELAKRHGFIPSYPPGATSQGPDPEAWEYVWVGVDNLLE